MRIISGYTLLRREQRGDGTNTHTHTADILESNLYQRYSTANTLQCLKMTLNCTHTPNAGGKYTTSLNGSHRAREIISSRQVSCSYLHKLNREKQKLRKARTKNNTRRIETVGVAQLK